MNARHQCTREGRTARFNLPVCRHSAFRRLLEPLLAPPTRLLRYRNLSTKMLENAVDELDRKRCAKSCAKACA